MSRKRYVITIMAPKQFVVRAENEHTAREWANRFRHENCLEDIAATLYSIEPMRSFRKEENYNVPPAR